MKENKKGTVYGVGVGPGDAELMTLKAVRLIRESDVVAVPGNTPEESTAYRIALHALPELAQKELLALPMPMVREQAQLARAHREAASLLMRSLDQGKNVAYLTLGDVAVYSTFGYLQRILEAEGYPVELVSGVPSFCAAAARLGISLVEGDEPLHILPACRSEKNLEERGTCVLMKSGTQMKAMKDMLRRGGREAVAVLNCGMENERLCRSLDEIPDDASYFTLLISKRA